MQITLKAMDLKLIYDAEEYVTKTKDPVERMKAMSDFNADEISRFYTKVFNQISSCSAKKEDLS